jgi:protein-disulfide isomerase
VYSTLVILIAIVLAILCIIAALTLSSYFSNEVLLQKTDQLSLSSLINYGSPILGSLSAPITLIDFSDFECHLCARYVKNTQPYINQTYIQTGKVNLVFKHLPALRTDSMGGSIAAQCTNDQGKFWQFHQLLYTNDSPIYFGWLNSDNLKKLSSKIAGLDLAKFNSCVGREKYKSFVEEDVALASSLGLQSTPSFIVVYSDGSEPEKIVGAQPFASFKAVIDNKLEAKAED